jgi:hypothetical protein
VSAHTDAKTLLVDATSVECLFSINPLPCGAAIEALPSEVFGRLAPCVGMLSRRGDAKYAVSLERLPGRRIDSESLPESLRDASRASPRVTGRFIALPMRGLHTLGSGGYC